MVERIFIDKTVFFPEQGILAVGDLHVGYDYMLVQSGVLVPERQIKETLEDFERIIEKIKSLGYELKKIVFLGDIKHSFGYEFAERNELREIIAALTKYVPEENIIFVKGNHDTMDYTLERKMKPYHIEPDAGIAFIHGHQTFPEIFDKGIKTVVLGHLHPSVILEETPGVKREIYKCFLEGESHDKNLIILPSFLGMSEGTPVNTYIEDYSEDFSIVPKKDIMKFRIHVVGDDEVLDFGEVREL